MSELTTVKHFFYDSDKIENQGRSFFLRTDGILHNGINIEGTEAVNCMADGKIVAMRLTDDYENINSIKEDESFDDNFLICYHLATKFQSGNIIKDETNNPEKYYFTKEVVKGHSIYKLNSNLKDYDKIEALYFLNEVISNNFVLIEHELIKLNGDKIKFYSLYNHIAPLGRMTYEQKLNLPWYEHKITVSNSKVDGYYTKNNRFLPCEYSVKKVKAEKGILEIIFTDLKSGESIKDQIDASYYSEKYGEIKEKSEQSKQEAGIPIYIIKKNGTRTFKEIVSNETEFEFDFNEIRSFNEKKTKMPLKVKYGDNKEGYIYLNEDKKYDEKTWKEAIEKFWKVINEKKDEEDFLNFQIKFNLKKEFKKNCIAYPNNFEVKAGTKIGYSGFNFMEEDKLAGNVVVLKDGKAKPFTIHVETFFSDKAELEFDYKNEEKWEPFYFKVNSNCEALTEKPTTEVTSSEDSYQMSLVELLGEDKIYSDEVYYKIKVIAKVKYNTSYVKNGEFTTWDEKLEKYIPNGKSPVILYNSDGVKTGTTTFNSDFYYLYGDKSNDYRKFKYFYELVNKEYYVKQDVFNSFDTTEKAANIYKQAEENKHYFIKSKLDSSNLYTQIKKKDVKKETINIVDSNSIHLKFLNKRIKEFEHNSTFNLIQVWYKTKFNEKEYWIKQSDINSEKNKTPIEVVSLNDWSKYSSIINLKNTTEYKVKDYKKINHVINTDEEDAKMEESLKNNESSGKKSFDEYKKQKKKNIEGLNSAFEENNNSLSDEIIYKLLKNENKGRNFIFEHRNEWDKNKKLIDAYKDSTKLKKQKFENTLKAYSFMDEVKTKIGNKDTFFYTNPFYFINNLDKIVSIPDFNPYEGKKYSEIFAKGKTNLSIHDENKNKINMNYENFVVNSNPGFAPLFDKTLGGPEVDGYACITGFFNANYYDVHNEVYKDGPKEGKRVYNFYYHEGVDFRGSEGTQVVSLINGRILRFGHTNSMGGFVLMQSKNNTNRYYLAVHLKESFGNLTFDSDIIPGTVIGTIGPYAGGPHLHVSVIDLPEGEEYENPKENGLGVIYPPKTTDSKKTYRFPTFDYNYREKMKNPFDYSKTWAGRLKN